MFLIYKRLIYDQYRNEFRKCFFSSIDDENEDLDFIKVVKVQSFDHQTQILPLQSVLRIEEWKWKTIVRDIIRKQIDRADENIDKLEESKMQLFQSKSFHPLNPLSLADSDGERDYLTEKIGKISRVTNSYSFPGLICMKLFQKAEKNLKSFFSNI